MPAVKIVIYSNRSIVQKGFECLFREAFDFPVLTYRTAEQIRSLDDQDLFLILIWDKDLLNKDLLSQVRNNNKVVIISIGRPKAQLMKMIDDFFPLKAELSYFVDRVKFYVDRYKNSQGQEDKNPENRLTEREEEIVKLIALGYTSQQIADYLSISPNTVVTHRKNIAAKLGIKTISGITIYAILNGLVSIDEVKDELK